MLREQPPLHTWVSLHQEKDGIVAYRTSRTVVWLAVMGAVDDLLTEILVVISSARRARLFRLNTTLDLQFVVRSEN